MKRIAFSIIMLLMISMLFAGGASERDSGEKLLVDGEWLEDNIGKVVVIDYGRSYEDFQEGHIPGAVYVDRALFWAEVNGVPGQLPDPEDVGAELGLKGINHRGTIVVYDAGNSLWASRAFWGLEVLGHKSVRLLDGGFAAWSDEGKDVSTSEETRSALRFRVRYQPELHVQSDEVLASYDSNEFVVLDTRSNGEYEGSDARADRGGHIPNAVNIDWIENITDTGSFKNISKLASIYDDTVDKTARVATHCQTGVRGAHSYFVLRVLGYEDVGVYDGGWAEWGNREDTPIDLSYN